VTAYCKRFISNCINQSSTAEEPKTPSMTLTALFNIQTARLSWEKYIQKKNFFHIFQNIETRKNDHLQKRLKLFIDLNDLLRCSGILINADVQLDVKFPKLFPKDNHFRNLVVEDKGLFHAGVHHILSEMRKEYWVVNGRSQVYKW
jgi:hypothetical protein